MKPRYLPALRGIFGDWAYYSCLMPMGEVADRVQYAKTLHNSEQLSELIQRELKKGRARDIARYLRTNEERFFNSLVVAVFDGDPAWYQLRDIRPERSDIDVDDLSSQTIASIGFLRFSGEEKLFALDGQHRLAGIKQAIRAKPELRSDEASVIFVSHKNTREGRRRTRRLFTTLNKTAKPVSKGDIIALDESDVMAIVARDLVENHPYFNERRILVVAKSNLPVGDVDHLTTIVNLYDVLKILFRKMKGQVPFKELQFNRPPDSEIERYKDFAIRYFTLLGRRFKELREYFAAKDPTRAVKRWRTKTGGSVLFRPVGLTIFTSVVVALMRNRSLEEAAKLASRLPRELSSEPYKGVLWNPSTRTMEIRYQTLVRELLLYMLGVEGTRSVDKLRTDLARTRGESLRNCKLPNRVVGY